MNGDEPSLEAEKKNGAYLLSVHEEYEGYTVKATSDQILVDNVTINGRYVATPDYFETECDGFEIMEDGTLNLRYLYTGSDQ